jgi:hypothetical protein
MAGLLMAFSARKLRFQIKRFAITTHSHPIRHNQAYSKAIMSTKHSDTALKSRDLNKVMCQFVAQIAQKLMVNSLTSQSQTPSLLERHIKDRSSVPDRLLQRMMKLRGPGVVRPDAAICQIVQFGNAIESKA